MSRSPSHGTWWAASRTDLARPLGVRRHRRAAGECVYMRLGIDMWFGMVIAAAVSAVLGVFMSLLDARFRLGHLSFALVTLAFAEIGELVVAGTDFLGGASGLDLPRITGVSGCSSSAAVQAISGRRWCSRCSVSWSTRRSCRAGLAISCARYATTRTRRRRSASSCSAPRRPAWRSAPHSAPSPARCSRATATSSIPRCSPRPTSPSRSC